MRFNDFSSLVIFSFNSGNNTVSPHLVDALLAAIWKKKYCYNKMYILVRTLLRLTRSHVTWLILVHHLHPYPSFFLDGLSSFWWFSTLIKYFFQVSLNARGILYVVKIFQNTLAKLFNKNRLSREPDDAVDWRNLGFLTSILQ